AALVGDLLHALLGKAMADELPPAFEGGVRNRLVSLDRRAVDREDRTDAQMVEYLEHARQNPTRLPYSCQAQFGMSGIGAPPAGGVSTVRGIGWVGSHSSTLTINQTANRAPS